MRIENGQSNLYVTEHKLYNIVKGADYGKHKLELIVTDPGLDAYTFTFG